MANRLANSTSPYLRQHAGNPVDWQEWGDEAFAEARDRNVPVLLSVGYAACHWCHVMAHESFEDDEVAAALSRGFVAVKVDREERPDIDAVYMSATTAMTGHGGWPMTCLLTPEAEPFWCGTYLPKAQFLQLLAAVSTAWREREQELRAGGARVVEALRRAQDAPRHTGTGGALGEGDLTAAVAVLHREFDDQHGGFGTAPKFPPSMVLAFLWRHHGRTGSEAAGRMTERTCEAMARSGTYDQLGGGFARYAVDRAWVIPHFEKMLYDNAQLIRVYTHLAARSQGGLAERVVRESVEFVLRDLQTPERGFASSLDADTEGVEGSTYVWTPDQLTEVLGERDGQRAAELLAVTDHGTFEEGASTLQLPTDPDDWQWWAATRDRLHRARSQRPQPARDDKVVTAWNGLLIAALADAGAMFAEPDWVEAARTCARLLLDRHLVQGRLRRSSLGGVVGSAHALAEDYGDLAEGLLALHAATADPTWLEAAGRLLDTSRELFSDGAGGFHDTAHDAEPLVLRPRSQGDNAEPSGASALASAFVLYGVLAGSPGHLAAGQRAVAAAAGLARAAPRFAGWTLATAELLVSGPVQVAIADGPGAEELAAVARRSAPSGSVVIIGAQDSVPLLQGRGPVDGRAAAYVCRGTVCALPETDPEVLAQALLSRPPPTR